jgi:cystathionine beta-lyase
VTGGPYFGSQGAGFARLNIGTSPELITEAVNRMAASVSDSARLLAG